MKNLQEDLSSIRRGGPKRFIKIRHGGYLSHNGKNKRIAAIHEQLKLPKP